MTVGEEEKLIQATANKKKMELIKQMVSAYYKQPVTDFTRNSRKREVVHFRYVAMWLMKTYTKAGLAEIGENFGKNYATVLYGCAEIEKFLSTPMEKKLQKEVAEIKALTEIGVSAIDGDAKLDDTHHYINLNTCTGIITGSGKSIVISGYSPEEVDKILSTLKESEMAVRASEPMILFENTGMYLIKKKNSKN